MRRRKRGSIVSPARLIGPTARGCGLGTQKPGSNRMKDRRRLAMLALLQEMGSGTDPDVIQVLVSMGDKDPNAMVKYQARCLFSNLMDRELVASADRSRAEARKAESASQDHVPNRPYSPDEAMTVPPGFAVGLVAAEPDIANPIAMSSDDRAGSGSPRVSSSRARRPGPAAIASRSWRTPTATAGPIKSPSSPTG